MRKKQRLTKKKRRLFDEQDSNIDDLIDNMAYLDENQNIRKSKKFLDNMYRLNDEE